MNFENLLDKVNGDRSDKNSVGLFDSEHLNVCDQFERNRLLVGSIIFFNGVHD